MKNQNPFTDEEYERLSNVSVNIINFFVLIFGALLIAVSVATMSWAMDTEVMERRSYIVENQGLQFGTDLLGRLQLMNFPAPVLRVHVTTYNPEEDQTDDSPCIGAGMEDLCYLYSIGVRPIAISKDLRASSWSGGGGDIAYGSYIELSHSNPRCNGVFQVLDAMNDRWTKRVDVFIMDKSSNDRCSDALMKKL